MRFERSWIPAIVAVAVIVLAQRRLFSLPRELLLALIAAGGAWLLWTAWTIWRNPTGGASLGPTGARVQYWRGQRIELEPPRRKSSRPAAPPTRQLVIALLYGLTGALMLAAALGGFINR